ncbi:MAG: ABC transporter permease [Candidatus Eremiobacteraeota bacterium]|nr:ABC transporter permease [Candidatus Eremiobacteraeota bacterium]MBV8222130.1 ABC transporter permease [Candidatus Eremiobacteraeota bacterium]MBV8280503.1 ABC transporter permease [Candidatus Eremiobacteraeota bacterium]
MQRVSASPVARFFDYAGGVALMFGDAVRYAVTLQVRVSEVFRQAYFLGVESWPIIVLVSLFTGAVISLETAKAAVQNGFTEYVGSSVAYGTFRELGPLLTGIVFAGRAGAAIAASLGAMKVTEQIEAFQSMGVSPVKVLVTPRLLACALAMPMLTVFADIVGISAGYYMAHWVAGIPQYTYFHSVQSGTVPSDFYNGLIKAAVFGAIIAIISCYEGFRTEGGADGVGRATTNAVVTAVILVFAFNFMLSYVLFR